MRWFLMVVALTACGPTARDAFHAGSARSIAGPSAAVATSRSAPFTLDLEAQRWTAQVEGYLDMHQPALADRVCSEADVDDAALDVACGIAALDLGDRHRAEARWSRGARRGSPAALLRLAVLRLEVRDWPGALDASVRLLGLAPRSYQALRIHAAALSGIGEFDRAEALLLRAVELAPERADAYLDLGILHALHRSGPDARADEYFRQFSVRAGTRPAYTRAIAALTRDCPRGSRRPRRGAHGARCVPGLMVLAEETRTPSFNDIEEMQRMAAEMEALSQRQAAAFEAAASVAAASRP